MVYVIKSVERVYGVDIIADSSLHLILFNCKCILPALKYKRSTSYSHLELEHDRVLIRKPSFLKKRLSLELHNELCPCQTQTVTNNIQLYPKNPLGKVMVCLKNWIYFWMVLCGHVMFTTLER